MKILINFIGDMSQAGHLFLPHLSDLLCEAFLVQEDLRTQEPLSPTPCAAVCFPFALRLTRRLNGLWLLLCVWTCMWTGPGDPNCGSPQFSHTGIGSGSRAAGNKERSL